MAASARSLAVGANHACAARRAPARRRTPVGRRGDRNRRVVVLRGAPLKDVTLRRVAALVTALALVPALARAAGSTLESRIKAERVKAQAISTRLHAKRAELHSVTLQYNDLQHQLGETT